MRRLIATLAALAALLWASVAVQAQSPTTVWLPLIAVPPPTATPTNTPTATVTPIGPTATATATTTATTAPIPPSPTATVTTGPAPVFGDCTTDPNPAAAPNTPLQIIGLDKSGEVVAVRNGSGAAISLDGWMLCSINGNQQHPIGAGVSVPANGSIDLPNGGAPIWNNSVRDDAALYDPTGRLVSYFVDP